MRAKGKYRHLIKTSFAKSLTNQAYFTTGEQVQEHENKASTENSIE